MTRVREFRWLWLADVQSELGDQVARVALSVLVYNQTHSSLLTAAMYALTFIPALLGSLLLGSLADRLPRRTLLVTCDLMRAALIATMAIVGQPLGLLAFLLVLAVIIGTPWSAAQSALLADVLAGEGYVLGTGLRFATGQCSQLVGFAVGGAAVAAIGPRWGLALDALTFLVSAIAIRIGVHDRPAALAALDDSGDSVPRSWLSGVRMIAGNRHLRVLLALSWLAGLFVVPEGLAAPYADELGGGAKTVGLLLAALPAGTVIGALLLSRFVRADRRTVLVGPLSVVAGLPLVLCGLRPGLAVTILLWILTGACAAYLIQIVAEYVEAIPNHARGQAMGLLGSGLLASQGIGLLAVGLVSQVFSPMTAVATFGAAAVLLALPLALSRRRFGAHSAQSPDRGRGVQPRAW